MLIYLLKANIILALLYILYRLFFCRDTFFNCRRATLLGIIAVALLAPLPLLQTLTGEWLPVEATHIMAAEALLPEFIVTPDAVQAGTGSGILAIAGWTYAIGVLLLLGRMAVQLASIARLSRHCPKKRVNGITVHVLPEGEAPFSFFHLIFVCPSGQGAKELDAILTHEQTHVRQWHSADVLVGEWMCILCWFNPVAWLLKGEIRQNLEYLADRHVLAEGYDKRSYQYHLLALSYHKAAATIYNHFNVLPLKKRISMMNKQRTKGIGRMKYLLFLPVAALLAMACSGNQNGKQEGTNAGEASEAVVTDVTGTPDTAAAPEQESTASSKVQGEIYDIVDQPPLFPGGPQAMMKFLGENIHYPVKAQENKTEGTVVCKFVVTAEGKVADVTILRSVSEELDNEAIRVIRSMPTWTPGQQDGQAVNVKYTLPIRFRLQ